MKRLMVALLSLVSVSAMAATLSLYQNPDPKSNVIATVKEGQAIVPIFNHGDWVKIGDPSNGNVGWVTKDQLQKSGYPQMSMQVSGTRDPKEAKKMMEKIEKQQEEFRASINQLMQQNLENMTKINQDFNALWSISEEKPGKK